MSILLNVISKRCRSACRNYSSSTGKMVLNSLNQRDSLVKLSSRGLIRISGLDTIKFLQGLLTNDVNKLKNEPGLYSAFLTPQGRVLADLFLHQTDLGIVVDCDATLLDMVHQQLKKYVLRSKVKLEKLEGNPYQTWGPSITQGFADPRHNSMGRRMLEPLDIESVSEKDYHLKRILLGVPEGAQDLFPGVALPLESNMDYMNGVDFHKGCYVGQELTIRTHHKGVTRKRIVPVQVSTTDSFTDELQIDTSFDHALPNSQSDIARVDGGKKELGKFCSGMHNVGLALIRLDQQGLGKTENLFVKPFIPEQFVPNV